MVNKPNLKEIASDYDRRNLALAREVKAQGEQYPPFMQQWAELVLQRLCVDSSAN